VSWSDQFVELDKSIHDRKSFDCGKEELNDFIKTKAAKHMAAGVSTTMVLPAASPIPGGEFPVCAFFAVTPTSVARETFDHDLVKRLPFYPVPVFLIAQLAVHVDHVGKGLGKISLIKALEYLWNINKQIRAFAVVVDCLDEEAQAFYAKYDFQVLCDHNGRVRMFLPMKTVGQLF